MKQYREIRKQLLIYVMETSRSLEENEQQNDVCVPCHRLNKFACIFEAHISRNLDSEYNVVQEMLIITKSNFSITDPNQVTNLLFR